MAARNWLKYFLAITFQYGTFKQIHTTEIFKLSWWLPSGFMNPLNTCVGMQNDDIVLDIYIYVNVSLLRERECAENI